ncbi:MAG: cation transporter [Firmicutes bacterium]|nr:cation transporter [Bacillota bacterium]
MSKTVMSTEQNRSRTIIRTSLIGVMANLALSGFKAMVGILSHSIAIIMDAVNNLSDALSSVITIIGTKLSGKAPDREHPFGHGRIEYLSAFLIAALVLYAGIAALVESVRKILHPVLPDYTVPGLIIIAAAVIVKLLLGRYVRKTGQRVNSGSLIASGTDAFFDAVISASTLAAALVYLFFHISLEAWLGAAIALLIIKSGCEMLFHTVSEMLGRRISAELAGRIKGLLLESPEVYGVYDLAVNDYGPDRIQGSVHLEVPESMTAVEIDQLSRDLQRRIYAETGVVLTAIGIYAHREGGEEAVIQEEVYKIVSNHPYFLQMHGFFVDLDTKLMRFDIILAFEAPDRQSLYDHICKDVQDAFPGYQLQIVLDVDASDSL